MESIMKISPAHPPTECEYNRWYIIHIGDAARATERIKRSRFKNCEMEITVIAPAGKSAKGLSTKASTVLIETKRIINTIGKAFESAHLYFPLCE